MNRVEAISYTYSFTPFSLRKFRKLPRAIQKRIFIKLQQYLETGNPILFAHKMSPPQSNLFRYRIGDYRVIVSAENSLITIHDVGHRQEIYQ
ncbi:hypothetical protein COY32_05920 [candidate division WWE3 bacterium CG_4_10_14_0_2_um_filter_41_14]|uniref:Type II toxin-antitoxin system RelE/ParE family toxin n=1 Tax=candidate division WWE3 bacterium CG_4_10_14_0_2_um_filter_41_14 TaxID=1975072 RepID=A0A2M7TGM9_UNCKA|nr:MAG: hypothetical protein COY32_05920 [candidate division WWE3 bacterium CG_4_10_14_0_2_um_filter_41_14]